MPDATSVPDTPTKNRQKILLNAWPLWLCLILAIGARGWLIIHTHGVIDGDEALVGIQAQHILQGERPIYFYHQSYMGSLEAYLVALSSFISGGLSAWSLRLTTALVSLVLICLTWKCAEALADSARLTPQVKRTFMSIATLVATLPPLYDMVAELRALGGYIEAFVIMLWLLYSALRLTQSWQAQRNRHEIAWRWAGIGFLVGLALWVDPITIYAITTIVLWISSNLLIEWTRSRTQGIRFSSRYYFIPPLAALPTTLIGVAPALYWGANNHWLNVSYVIFDHTGAQTLSLPRRLTAATEVAQNYLSCMAPRVLGGALSTQPGVTSTNPHLLTFGLCIAVACLSIVIISTMNEDPLLIQLRQLTLLPCLFIACTTLIFCSSSSSLFTLDCGPADLTGRYLTPLVIVLPFIIAAVFSALLTGKQIYPAGTADTPAQHNTHIIGRLIRSWEHLATEKARLCRILSILLLIAYFGTQWMNYLQSDPDQTFQSTYCHTPPADYSALINYIEQAHIHYIWGSNWLVFPITYASHGAIVATQLDGARPEDIQRVMQADRPSLMLFVLHTDNNPQPLRLLNSNRIRYHIKRFAGQRGYDVLLVTPLNRTISPKEQAFRSIFQGMTYDKCS